MKKKVNKTNLEFGEVLKPLFGIRVFVLIACTMNNLVGLIPPYMIGLLIDNITGISSGNYSIDAIVGLCIGIAVLLILEFFLNWLQNYSWFKMVHKGSAMISTDVFKKMLMNKDAFFRKYKSGDIVNRVVNDSSAMAQTALILTPVLFLNCLTLLIVFGFLFYMNIVMASTIAVLCVLYFIK